MSQLMISSKLTNFIKKVNYFSTSVLTTLRKEANEHSTIFALSSGFGKCGVAVIRISGPRSMEAVKKIGGFKNAPEPRKAFLRKLRDPVTNDILDHGLVLWFPGPKSFTGEDSCELQVHGGPAVISAVLSALSNLRNFRPAEAGEFTRRAFYAGKLNLTEVEGLGDLIHSETELQRKQALIQMEGALGNMYSRWRDLLLECAAHFEAYIDFSEDQHLEDNILEKAKEKALYLHRDMQKHLQDGRRGERLRDGVKTVILGAPNVGKSSLMNTLCHKKTAIVSSIPGTTRDIIKSTIDISGFPVILADTAGLRSSTNDVIEEEGITCAKSCASDSDLIILVLDVNDFLLWCSNNNKKLKDYIRWYIETLDVDSLLFSCENIRTMLEDCEIQSNGFSSSVKCLLVFNKVDLLTDLTQFDTLVEKHCSSIALISCKTGAGLEKFLNKLAEMLKLLCGDPNREQPNYSQARHRHYLASCSFSLEKCLEYSENEVDLAAHELRNAISSLGKITGHISTEQILDVIFKEFCIGK